MPPNPRYSGGFYSMDENKHGWSAKVRAEGDLETAIEKALAHGGLSLIEVIIDRDDCSKELLEWGSRVSANNSRPPICAG